MNDRAMSTADAVTASQEAYSEGGWHAVGFMRGAYGLERGAPLPDVHDNARFQSGFDEGECFRVPMTENKPMGFFGTWNNGAEPAEGEPDEGWLKVAARVPSAARAWIEALTAMASATGQGVASGRAFLDAPDGRHIADMALELVYDGEGWRDAITRAVVSRLNSVSGYAKGVASGDFRRARDAALQAYASAYVGLDAVARAGWNCAARDHALAVSLASRAEAREIERTRAEVEGRAAFAASQARAARYSRLADGLTA